VGASPAVRYRTIYATKNLLCGTMNSILHFVIMENLPTPRSSSRSTIGEALIVISVIIGFFAAFMDDKVSLQDIWSIAWFLVLIVIFYMALLFCRMLFFWMTGGDQAQYPWWMHAEMAKKMKS